MSGCSTVSKVDSTGKVKRSKLPGHLCLQQLNTFQKPLQRCPSSVWLQFFFSISLNERFVLEGGFVGLFDWIVKHEDLYFATWLARDILNGNYSYEEVIHQLSTRPLLAPCYYIVSGVEHNQGIIITRGLNESLYPLQMNTEQGRWYLLETNYDHWKKPFFIVYYFLNFYWWNNSDQ